MMEQDAFFDALPGANLPLEDVGARGAEWYASLQPEIEEANEDGYLAIDVANGEYAIARSTAQAMRILIARRPGAQLFLRKIGSGSEPELALRAFGGHPAAPAGRKL
jgi:hypothetical protein